MKQKVLAVVVTYNRLEMLKKTVCAIEAQSAACDLLLVNNASTDETEDWAFFHSALHASSEGRRFLYENTGENLGGAGGFHFGMKKAVALGYDLVWVMDDDAVPKPDTLQKLLAPTRYLQTADKTPTYGFLSSIVRWTDGALCEMNRQRLSSHYIREEDVSEARSKSMLLPAETATFVSLLIPKETIVRVGLPIKEFFIWGDDVEYTSRITRRYKIPSFLVPDSEIVHETKTNIGSDIVSDEEGRIDRYFYSSRNGGYAYRHYSLRMYLSYLFHQASSLLRILLYAKDNKKRRCRVLLSGFRKGLSFRPEIEHITLPE